MKTNSGQGKSLTGRKLLWGLVMGLGLGCAFVAGGCMSSSGAKVEARTTTVGQELKDLDDARNKGLLTEDEYNKKREQIMKQK